MKMISDRFKALGTDILIKIIIDSEKKAEKAKQDIQEIKLLYQKYQSQLSRFDPESEISNLNKNSGKFQKASPEIIHLAKNSLFYNKESTGIFDPRIITALENSGYANDFNSIDFSEIQPNITEKIEGDLKDDLKIRRDEIYFKKRMDFTGIAKGFITDKIAEFLRRSGWKNFLVDSGGDMFASGTNGQKENWRISMEGFPEEKLQIKLSNEAIATSGISRKKWTAQGTKFHHLINPQDPENFSFDLRSVTVISDTTEEADAWAKILFLMGKKEGLAESNKKGYRSLFLDYRGNLIYSNQTKENFCYQT